MSPTIKIVGPFRFFFNSREETRRHVHIATKDGVAKFWLEPIVALASYYNLQEKELRKIESIVKEHENDFTAAWENHFSQ
jgi:formyltetrahydrofolate synthetase